MKLFYAVLGTLWAVACLAGYLWYGWLLTDPKIGGLWYAFGWLVMGLLCAVPFFILDILKTNDNKGEDVED